jgi:hypothetical protein
MSASADKIIPSEPARADRYRAGTRGIQGGREVIALRLSTAHDSVRADTEARRYVLHRLRSTVRFSKICIHRAPDCSATGGSTVRVDRFQRLESTDRMLVCSASSRRRSRNISPCSSAAKISGQNNGVDRAPSPCARPRASGATAPPWAAACPFLPEQSSGEVLGRSPSCPSRAPSANLLFGRRGRRFLGLLLFTLRSPPLALSISDPLPGLNAHGALRLDL